MHAHSQARTHTHTHTHTRTETHTHAHTCTHTHTHTHTRTTVRTPKQDGYHLLFVDSVLLARNAMEDLDSLLSDRVREVAITHIARSVGVERKELDEFIKYILN